MRLGIIGAGSIASLAIKALTREKNYASGDQQSFRSLEILSILVRPSSRARGEALINDARDAGICRDGTVVYDKKGLIALQPDLVVECAGHEAVATYGLPILAAGINLALVSVGALADDTLHASLRSAAEARGVHLRILPGAIGGIDILSAAKLSGLEEVTYTARKSINAWRGTKAEALLDLDRLVDEAVFFEGSARAAAREYPENANVAATIALAGLGFERTQVRLIADPKAERTVHVVSFRACAAEAAIRISGYPAANNPKTSQTTGLAVARHVLNCLQGEVI